tara:strand:- start:9155 stop:10435 length:1281 start_codon:yes stop_codon:yes gene_type:complete
MKIWNSKNQKINQKVDTFLSGEDINLDNEIFIFDVDASIAHTEELLAIKILTRNEASLLKRELKKIKKNFLSGKLTLNKKFEDCHSAIEYLLIKELGDVGKKIHTGRSRNDQVLVALRLYQQHYLKIIRDLVLKLAKELLSKSKQNEYLPMPGYTHLQRAMPSTWGLWFSSYVEAFLDDVELLDAISDWININPLGTAAGYGVNLPIKRELSTKKLGFRRPQVNALYVQNSRGKMDLEILGALKQPFLDLRKLSWDLSLFTSTEFDLIKIGEEFTTGSSIMPNKSNPDTVEIMRANYAKLAGYYAEIENLISLPSGYHRDLQISKGAIINAFNVSESSFSLAPALIKSLKINKKRAAEMIDSDMQMTDQVNALVQEGVPFRDAYRSVKNNPNKYKSLSSKTYTSSVGSANNLKLSLLSSRLKKLAK